MLNLINAAAKIMLDSESTDTSEINGISKSVTENGTYYARDEVNGQYNAYLSFKANIEDKYDEGYAKGYEDEENDGGGYRDGYNYGYAEGSKVINNVKSVLDVFCAHAQAGKSCVINLEYEDLPSGVTPRRHKTAIYLADGNYDEEGSGGVTYTYRTISSGIVYYACDDDGNYLNDSGYGYDTHGSTFNWNCTSAISDNYSLAYLWTRDSYYMSDINVKVSESSSAGVYKVYVSYKYMQNNTETEKPFFSSSSRTGYYNECYWAAGLKGFTVSYDVDYIMKIQNKFQDTDVTWY